MTATPSYIVAAFVGRDPVGFARETEPVRAGDVYAFTLVCDPGQATIAVSEEDAQVYVAEAAKRFFHRHRGYRTTYFRVVPSDDPEQAEREIRDRF